jgi:hypothetical protein
MAMAMAMVRVWWSGVSYKIIKFVMLYCHDWLFVSISHSILYLFLLTDHHDDDNDDDSLQLYSSIVDYYGWEDNLRCGNKFNLQFKSLLPYAQWYVGDS